MNDRSLGSQEVDVREAFEHVPVALGIADLNGQLHRVNQEFCALLNRPSEELLATTLQELTSRQDLTADDQFRSLIEGKTKSISVQLLYRRPTEKPVCIEFVLSLLSGSSKLLVAANDLSAVKDAGALLERERIDRAHLERLAKVGSWRWDAKSDAIEWSETLALGCGCDPKLPAPPFKEHYRFFSPDSWTLLTEHVSRAVGDGTGYELILEAVRPSGEKAWVIARGEAERNQDGQITGLRGTIQDITDRVHDQKALRDSTEKFEKAFRCSPQTFTISTIADDRYLDVNEAFELTTGYTREEAIGRTTEELGIWENRPERDKLVERAIRGEKIRNVECRFRKKNGETFIGLLSAELIDQIAGVPSVVANVIDITDWRKAEEALRASERNAALFTEQTMFGVVEWDQNFRVVRWNEAAEAIFGYAQAEAVGRHANELIVPAHLQKNINIIFQELIHGQGSGSLSVNENVRKTGERILCEWFNTPLTRPDGQVIGVMSLVLDITEKRRTERALKETQDRYRGLVESSHDWIWQVDAECRYTYVGAQCRHLLGYEPEEILGKTPFELMPEQEAARVAKVFGPIAAAHQPFRGLENTNVTKSGQRIILETNGTPVFDHQGNFAGYRGMDRDVTERKRAEIALRESEAKYRTLADNLPGVVFQFYAKESGEWGFHFVHESAGTILGITAEPLHSFADRFNACLDPVDRSRCVQSVQQAIASCAAWDFETKFTKPSGDELFIRGASRPQRRDGELVFHGILFDTTARNRAEEALRESEDRFRRVVEHIGDALFVDDVDGHVVFANDRFLNLFGFKRDELPNLALEDYIAPEYRDALRDRHDRRVRGDVVPSHFEYEGCRRDGTRLWLEVDVVAVKDKHGEVIGTQSALRDVSERKRMLEALRKSEDKFSKAFRESPMALTLTSAEDHRYLEVNEAFERYTGWHRDEVKGKTPFDLKIWDLEQRQEFVRRVQAHESVRDFELRYRCKDGTERWALGAGELINIDGEPCILAVIADITERKQAEAVLAGVSRRLIQAQEQERTRIARELHDDIAQRLALLANQVEMIRANTRRPELRADITEVREQLISIVSSVQGLSHELHSSKLEYFGLVPAVKSFCTEFSEGEKVAIDFQNEDVPGSLPVELSLSLFRVLQEALRNAVKHSNVRHFDVHLWAASGDIHLTVVDDGVGFDVETMMKGAGLGLVSMRERLKLVGGDLSITSQPLRGTTVHARAPLSSTHDLAKAAS